MFALLTNNLSGESFIRNSSSVVDDLVISIVTPDFQNLTKTLATDEFDLIQKALSEYIGSQFSISIDAINLALSLGFAVSPKRTVETVRAMFHEQGEVIRIAIEDSEFAKISKRLVSKSDMDFARTVTRRREMNIDDAIDEQYLIDKHNQQ